MRSLINLSYDLIKFSEKVLFLVFITLLMSIISEIT